MEKYRVYATINDIEYGLSQIVYDDDRGVRFELIQAQGKSTIYPNKEIAKEVIENHKRTRNDQKVDEYKLVTVLN